MVESILGILEAGLSLWQSYEKRKYVDKLMSLKRDYYNELKKDPAERSDAVLDNIRFELLNLGAGFSAAVKVENLASVK